MLKYKACLDIVFVVLLACAVSFFYLGMQHLTAINQQRQTTRSRLSVKGESLFFFFGKNYLMSVKKKSCSSALSKKVVKDFVLIWGAFFLSFLFYPLLPNSLVCFQERLTQSMI